MALRGIFWLLVSGLACGQSMDDAVRGLAMKVSAHLAANETVRVVSRNMSSLSQADVARVQLAMDRALRRRVRNPVPVEIMLAISENVKGFLLIAEIHRENERIVETENFRIDAAPAAIRPRFTITKKTIWEQEKPILDVAAGENKMFVLDIDGVSRFERRENGWQRAESAALPANIRDPRGRLTIGEAITVSIPGSICRGTMKPLSVSCESGGEFTAGRNTIESSEGPPSYSHEKVGEETLFVETDGRVHIYDAANKPLATFDDWGADFAILDGCANRIAASSSSEHDSVALYEMVNHAPVRVSEPVEFPGPVTALWSSGIAVAHNLLTGRYEAYKLTVDCGR